MAAFDEACSFVEMALTGAFRRHAVGELSAAADLGRALTRLRDGLGANALAAGGRTLSFDGFVRDFDRRARADGFHVLHDWDGKADRVNPDAIPVDVANYLIEVGAGGPPDPPVVAILLDYYLFNILCLLSLRIWDGGSADENLEGLGRLLDRLQGPDGSGHRFVSHAGTLILVATAHFELEERGYHALLEKVTTLDAAHRAKIALDHAGCLGCHLRFGFEATYGRDTIVMRNDNVADYPWLSFALSTLMDEYAAGRDPAVAEGLLNGLSPDALAFVKTPPFAERFAAHGEELVEHFETFRPSDGAYSPLSFFFNFSHNVVKGTVVDALLRGVPWATSLNDLLTALPREPQPQTNTDEHRHRPQTHAHEHKHGNDAKLSLGTTLMGYARRNPDRIGGRLMPVIVYDPRAGRQAFAIAMRKLRGVS
jgi:hypothetical protein